MIDIDSSKRIDSLETKHAQIISMQSPARYLIVDGHSVIFALAGVAQTSRAPVVPRARSVGQAVARLSGLDRGARRRRFRWERQKGGGDF